MGKTDHASTSDVDRIARGQSRVDYSNEAVGLQAKLSLAGYLILSGKLGTPLTTILPRIEHVGM